MPRIFERFYKSDRSRGLDKNGIGLGLYIVQTAVALHKGEVLGFGGLVGAGRTETMRAIFGSIKSSEIGRTVSVNDSYVNHL